MPKNHRLWLGLPAHHGPLVEAENRVVALKASIDREGVLPEPLPRVRETRISSGLPPLDRLKTVGGVVRSTRVPVLGRQGSRHGGAKDLGADLERTASFAHGRNSNRPLGRCEHHGGRLAHRPLGVRSDQAFGKAGGLDGSQEARRVSYLL